MNRLLLGMAVVLAFPLHAERVRVVVAVDVSQVSALDAESLRASVIDSLQTAGRVENWGEGPAFAAEIDSAELDLLRRDPRVRAVSVDTGGHGALLESVPLIGANVAQSHGYDGRGVTLAVLDTGIDVAHRDFAGRIVDQQCFCDNQDGTGCCPGGATSLGGPGAAVDDHGHGTHVSGIIAGGGVSAPPGVAPAARLLPVKVLDRDNSFKSFTQIYRALDWILRSRPEVGVINMSLGSWALYEPGTCTPSAIGLGMQGVVAGLRQRGVLIVASSGNQRSASALALPACMAGVLAVGATYDATGSFAHGTFQCSDPNASRDQVTCFTNSSAELDLLAPGAPIVSARNGGGFTTKSGTSMAAPHVAGAIALMLQAGSGLLSPDQIVTLLKTSGQRVVDSRNGIAAPRLDIGAALGAIPRPPRRRGVRK